MNKISSKTKLLLELVMILAIVYNKMLENFVGKLLISLRTFFSLNYLCLCSAVADLLKCLCNVQFFNNVLSCFLIIFLQ